MRFVQPSSESEMIACFLEQEYANHARYRGRIEECLVVEGISATRLTRPDITDRVANVERRSVFARYRGYGTDQPSYLTGFPDHGVTWIWVGLTPAELLDSTLIRYISTHELAANTRDPRMAAQRIDRGDLTSQFAENVRDLADRMRAGYAVPPVMLVSADGGSTRVVLEGHTRVLAWALAPETIAPETEVLLGMSEDIACWDEY